ncbi:MAG TPA: helix-turn-helix transcriptional regulator [Candidatus Scybalocola faecavium]|nr:helix-turn-helix transcriptional regulator [Candidatus Scybalocola faecavium]
MADEEQKRIFSKNLNKFLSQSQKTQKEVAEAINVSPQTFNTWCQGIALPRMGKVQKLADYFGILKSDLIDDKEDSDLTSRDKRDIAKDLDRIMAEIKNGDDGPLYYNGTEIDDASINLLENAIEFALTQAKKENKVKYNPNKNKK